MRRVYPEDVFLWGLFGASVALVLAITLAAVLHPAAAEAEKPERTIAQWQLGWLPRPTDDHRSRVDVIDTGSVCLYVVQSYAREVDTALPRAADKSLSVGLTVAITSVPKSQLEVGKGCQ